MAQRRVRIRLDDDGFGAVERLAAYEIGNLVLTQMLALQRHFGLRAELHQVFLVIVLATVQRYVRNPDADPEYVDRRPLSPTLAGGISRRRVAEVLDIPFETVRRHCVELLRRGLVVEHARGQLSTPGGTLEGLSADEIPRKLTGQIAGAGNALLRLGALRCDD
jgi:hypothetical protein